VRSCSYFKTGSLDEPEKPEGIWPDSRLEALLSGG
jgi:hypothetical protein